MGCKPFVITTLVAILAISGCNDQVRPGWERGPSRNFTFYVPVGFRRQPLTCFDSECWHLQGDGISLDYACGDADGGCPRDSGQHVTVHGASQATLWVGYPAGDSLAPYTVTLFVTSKRPPYGLSFTARCATEDARQRAITILRTTSFHRGR